MKRIIAATSEGKDHSQLLVIGDFVESRATADCRMHILLHPSQVRAKTRGTIGGTSKSIVHNERAISLRSNLESTARTDTSIALIYDRRSTNEGIETSGEGIGRDDYLRQRPSFMTRRCCQRKKRIWNAKAALASRPMSMVALCVWMFLIESCTVALDNGLALTPPMGWLSWERFGCNIDCERWPETCISERLYLRQAQRLVSDGYADAGYRYVNIDDCWSARQRQNSTNDPLQQQIVEDPLRFPNGLRALGRQLRTMGLKLGLYGDIGTLTCAGYPGFANHFEQDAHRLAIDFEIDSLKVDVCHANISTFSRDFPAFSKALNATGRPILLNCQWPLPLPGHGEDPNILPDVARHCSQWRNYYDVFDSWSSIRSIVDFWSRPSPDNALVQAAGPGHWNDPDMLVVGNPGLSLSEQQAQFSLWAMFAAPLYISADLYRIPEASRQILLNRDIIAVSQDVLGRQGWCASGCHDRVRIYVRELLPSTGMDHMPIANNASSSSSSSSSSDTWAVVLANLNSIFGPVMIRFDPRDHLPRTVPFWNTMYVRDLIEQRDWPPGLYPTLETSVDESTVAMFRIVLQQSNKSESAIERMT